MATAAILNMNPESQAYIGKTPAPMAAADSSGSSASSSSGAATITANDFLTLLVTELKNQDPTANRDPNEYINQLVQVNSLQQLISINEVLTSSLGDPSTSSRSTAQTESASSAATKATIATNTPAASAAAEATTATSPFIARRSAGNLGIPATNPSAMGLAHALDGNKSRTTP